MGPGLKNASLSKPSPWGSVDASFARLDYDHILVFSGTGDVLSAGYELPLGRESDFEMPSPGVKPLAERWLSPISLAYLQRILVKSVKDIGWEPVVDDPTGGHVPTQPQYRKSAWTDWLLVNSQGWGGSGQHVDWAQHVATLDRQDNFAFGRAVTTSLGGLKQVNPEWADRIEHLSKLKPNWDGYGADAVSKVTIATCCRILRATAKFPDPLLQQLFIAPLADGGLELEWECPSGRELMVVIPPQGGLARFLLTTFDASGNETERDGTIPADATIDTLFREVSA